MVKIFYDEKNKYLKIVFQNKNLFKKVCQKIKKDSNLVIGSYEVEKRGKWQGIIWLQK
ncbi:hypothetical protein J7K86_02015 [bacterium]|nr:hypothetical protein [bacterium]